MIFEIGMVKDEAVEKLVQKIASLISTLEQSSELSVHSTIEQFYYMERVAEIKFLNEQMQDLEARLEMLKSARELRYFELASRWRVDARWLHRHQRWSEKEFS